jgi:hypothetical protein
VNGGYRSDRRPAPNQADANPTPLSQRRNQRMNDERERAALHAAALMPVKPGGATIGASSVPIDWLRKYSSPKPIRRGPHDPPANAAERR